MSYKPNALGSKGSNQVTGLAGPLGNAMAINVYAGGIATPSTLPSRWRNS